MTKNTSQIKVDPSNDDFGVVLNCAVRYALGRKTYLPYTVIDFITPLLQEISDRTLWCFDRDLEDCKDFGDPSIDEPEWKKFQSAVQKEIQRRKNNHVDVS